MSVYFPCDSEEILFYETKSNFSSERSMPDYKMSSVPMVRTVLKEVGDVASKLETALSFPG